MRKAIMVFAVLAIVITCSMVNVSAVEICMKVKVVQISPDHDGMDVVVVENEDGATFMFSDIEWKAKVGQKLYMYMKLTYTKGNMWIMEEGDDNIYLVVKNTKGGK